MFVVESRPAWFEIAYVVRIGFGLARFLAPPSLSCDALGFGFGIHFLVCIARAVVGYCFAIHSDVAHDIIDLCVAKHDVRGTEPSGLDHAVVLSMFLTVPVQ